MNNKIELSAKAVEAINQFLAGAAGVPKVYGVEFSVDNNGNRAVHVPGFGIVAWTTSDGALMAQARFFKLLPFFYDWVTQWQGYPDDNGGMLLLGKNGQLRIGPSDPIGFYNSSGGNLNPLKGPGEYYPLNNPAKKEPPKDGNGGPGHSANDGDGQQADGDDGAENGNGSGGDVGDEKSKSMAYSDGGSEGQSEGKGNKGKGKGGGGGGNGPGGGSNSIKENIGRAYRFAGPGSKEWNEKMGSMGPVVLEAAHRMMEKFGICSDDVGTLISVTPNRAMFQLWKDCRFVTMPLRNPIAALPVEALVEQEKKRYSDSLDKMKFCKADFNRSKLPKPGYRYLARGERLNPKTDVWGDGFKDNISVTSEEQNKQEIVGPCSDNPHYPFSLYARKVDMVSSGADGIIRFDGLEFEAVLVQQDGSEVALAR